ncbi:hypothetical protein EFA69_10485 [Rufibacter immobilis]|uniref:Uncharacterized protein n=1 Tax=Rufibacter immobilis TaxID=1348778 RepID=A0A3M9MXR6_9BACT|nr:hypothetical protein [Rufibacter immobilis]RNI29945.1 hypothetical protein EFA69_10485 [Rufibacter immobilis]
MTLRLLPHYFKKIGLILFVGASLPDFIRGITSGYYDFHQASPSGDTSLLPLPSQTLWILEIIAILGIVLYAMAKDRIHDELLQWLRMEAIEITFFLTVVIVSIGYFFSHGFRIHPSYLINLQLIVFLIIYYVKKQSITSAN